MKSNKIQPSETKLNEDEISNASVLSIIISVISIIISLSAMIARFR